MKNYLDTRVNQLLGCKYPIIQGGMGWIADHNLAGAVSNAGGLGIIAAANAEPDVMREEIRLTREITNKNFGINIMLMSPWAEDIAKMVVQEGVKFVTTGGGDPGKYLKLWKKNGICVMPIVSSVAFAKMMEREGADAIIAEGIEAGGHIGQISTMALVPQIVDAVDVPVIAAGGIGDGRGYMAAMMLGAEGVQLGTRFVVATETNVHENYKDKFITARDADTIITGIRVGQPVRALKNRLTRIYKKLEEEGVSNESLEELTNNSFQKAIKEGNMDQGTVMAGQIVGLIRKKQSCREIIDEIVAEVVGFGDEN